MTKLYKKSPITRKLILAVTLLFVSSLVSIGVNYKSMGVFRLVHKKLPIYNVDTKDKKISLTFDVSWGDDNTMQLLDILDKYKVKATFFIVGGWIEGNESTLKEIVKRGHELGNHSNKHPDMSTITKEKIVQDILTCDAKLMSAAGVSTNLFRCPSGEYNDLVIEAVQSTGHYCIQWDVDSIDWKENGPSIEYNRVIKNAKPGSILLFHNNAKYTPETLPRIIDKLQKDGYTFVKTSELIYKDNYYIDPMGKQISK